MRRVRRSERAEADLLDIWFRVASDDPAAAERLLRRIDEACNKLATFPGMGARRPDLAPGFRLFPIGSYLVLYRQDGAEITIVRVLHGARPMAGSDIGHRPLRSPAPSSISPRF